MKFIDLFAGVGGFRLGMESNGHECVGWCEQDKFAQKSYRAIHDTDGEWFHDDIRDVRSGELPEADCYTGGFPCQSFSVAGERGGLNDTRGTLFFEIARLAKERQPQYLFLENVRGLLSHDEGRTFATILQSLRDMGYSVEWKVLNSKNFGTPQNRERVFIVGHLGGFSGGQVFPIKGKSRETDGELKQVGNFKEDKRDIDNPETGRVYSDDGVSPCLNSMSGGDREPKVVEGLNTTKDDKSFCIDANYHKGASPSRIGNRRTQIKVKPVMTPDFTDKGMNKKNQIGSEDGNMFTVDGTSQHGVKLGTKIRKLTPKECWRLQGFPDWAFERAEEFNSDTQLYKQAGNSVTVNVIEAISERFKETD